MTRPKNIKTLSRQFPASKLNSLYLGKTLVYNGADHTLKSYYGNIINIAYYKGLEGPHCEVKLNIWNGRTVNKVLPLSEVILVSANKVKKLKKFAA